MTSWVPLLEGTEGTSYVDYNQHIVVKHTKKWPFTCLYWKKLNHKNIQQLLRVDETKDKDLIYTQYAEGKELFEVIKNTEYIKIAVKLYIMIEILDGVQYLHQKNIAHMDIKPENIIVSNDFKSVKIIDLNRAVGMSNCLKKSAREILFSEEKEETAALLQNKRSQQEQLHKEVGYLYTCGTTKYMAPEFIVISKTEHNISTNQYTREKAIDAYKAADIYSLGQTFINLLHFCTYPYEKKCYLYRNIYNIIVLMTSEDPKKRPDIDRCMKLFHNDNILASSFSLE